MDSYREIENLIYNYALLIDTGNFKGLSELFKYAQLCGPNGEAVANGAEEFLALQLKAVKVYPQTGTPCTKHITTNLIINVNEEQSVATAKSYFTVLQSVDDLPLQPIISGRYNDCFERVDGSWRFTKRQSIPELFGNLSKHLSIKIAN